MPLRTDPLKELLELQERMNLLFEASLSRDRLDAAGLPPSGWVPSADVFETAEGFLIEVELPGPPLRLSTIDTIGVPPALRTAASLSEQITLK